MRSIVFYWQVSLQFCSQFSDFLSKISAILLSTDSHTECDCDSHIGYDANYFSLILSTSVSTLV